MTYRRKYYSYKLDLLLDIDLRLPRTYTDYLQHRNSLQHLGYYNNRFHGRHIYTRQSVLSSRILLLD